METLMELFLEMDAVICHQDNGVQVIKNEIIKYFSTAYN